MNEMTCGSARGAGVPALAMSDPGGAMKPDQGNEIETSELTEEEVETITGGVVIDLSMTRTVMEPLRTFSKIGYAAEYGSGAGTEYGSAP